MLGLCSTLKGWIISDLYLCLDYIHLRRSDYIRPLFMLGLYSTLKGRIISDLYLCSDYLPYIVGQAFYLIWSDSASKLRPNFYLTSSDSTSTFQAQIKLLPYKIGLNFYHLSSDYLLPCKLGPVYTLYNVGPTYTLYITGLKKFVWHLDTSNKHNTNWKLYISHSKNWSKDFSCTKSIAYLYLYSFSFYQRLEFYPTHPIIFNLKY